jgi:hypothetical protein
MTKRLCITVFIAAMGTGAFAQGTPSGDTAKGASAMSSRTAADCEKLTGAERDTCLRDARAAGDAAKKPATGATPGTSGAGTGRTTGSGTPPQASETQPGTSGAAGGKSSGY